MRVARDFGAGAGAATTSVKVVWGCPRLFLGSPTLAHHASVRALQPLRSAKAAADSSLRRHASTRRSHSRQLSRVVAIEGEHRWIALVGHDGVDGGRTRTLKTQQVAKARV